MSYEELTEYLKEERFHIRNYLDSRLNEEYQEKYNIGYFSDTLFDLEIVKELELVYDRTYYDFGNVYKKKECFFEYHRMIIPFYDQYGEIVSLVGRSLLSAEERVKLNIPKYKNTKFKKSRYLFGLNFAKEEIVKENCVYVVEGQFDQIAGYSNNLRNIVAVGSANISDYQFSVLKRYSNNIIFVPDNDEAGEKSVERINKRYKDYGNVKFVKLPFGYKDLDEFLKDNFIEDFKLLEKR